MCTLIAYGQTPKKRHVVLYDCCSVVSWMVEYTYDGYVDKYIYRYISIWIRCNLPFHSFILLVSHFRYGRSTEIIVGYYWTRPYTIALQQQTQNVEIKIVIDKEKWAVNWSWISAYINNLTSIVFALRILLVISFLKTKILYTHSNN